MSALRIVIPGEMRGKSRPRFSTRGGFARAYTDTATANAEAWVKHCAVQAGAKPSPLPLAVTVAIGVAIPRSWSKAKRAAALAGTILPTSKPDIDNVVKLICDALNGIAWEDDKQIVRLTCLKGYIEEPQTVVEVAEEGTTPIPVIQLRMAVPVEPLAR